MKQTVDAIITLPVKALFEAVYFYFMFHKKKSCVDSMDDYLDFFSDHETGLLLNSCLKLYGTSGWCRL